MKIYCVVKEEGDWGETVTEVIYCGTSLEEAEKVIGKDKCEGVSYHLEVWYNLEVW